MNLYNLMAEPANRGPHNSSQPVMEWLLKLSTALEPFEDEVTEHVLDWAGTYLLPDNQLALPCPPDQDPVQILDPISNSLHTETFINFLNESLAALAKTVGPARGELERRSAGLTRLLDRAQHNARVEATGEEDEEVERHWCPICGKRFGFQSQIWCDHYFCGSSDCDQFCWNSYGPDFFDSVDQLNRTINRPRNTDAVFEALVAEAPADLGALFKLVRRNGADYWAARHGVGWFTWYTNGCGSSGAYTEYFHLDLDALVTSVTTEAEAALGWLKAHRPELVVKRYHHGYVWEARYWSGYTSSWRGEDADDEESYQAGDPNLN